MKFGFGLFLMSCVLVTVSEAGIMDDLEPYFYSNPAGKTGIAFKCSNGNYMGVRWLHHHMALACFKRFKDTTTRFYLYKDPSAYNAVQIKASYNDKWFQVFKYSNSEYSIQAGREVNEAPRTSPLTIFKVFQGPNAPNNVTFRTYYNKYWNVVHRHHQDGIEANLDGPDATSQFKFETASPTGIEMKILSVKMGKADVANPMKPTIVDTHTIVNYGTEDIEKSISFTKTISETSTTTWEHAWGVSITHTVSLSYDFKIGISASASLSSTISYSGKYAKSNEKRTERTITDSTTVRCGPKKRCVAKLIVKEDNNVRIPFAATVQETSDLGRKTYIQRGVWHGSIYRNSFIEFHEENV